jgi:5-formyltetrahydrofolate cyclo-ligase
MAPLSSSDLTEQKRALRREMGERRAALADDERRARSDAAATRLGALPELAAIGGRTVAGYVAVVAKGEIDPSAALADAARRGAKVALPRVAAEPPRLRFHRADAAPLVPGRFGLMEPAAAAPEVALDDLDVVIVPGLAFDAEGRRVGSGGGYYDGAFSSRAANVGLSVPGTPGSCQRRAALIGLCYDFQIVARCPVGAEDVPVDLVVTDARVLRPAGAKR